MVAALGSICSFDGVPASGAYSRCNGVETTLLVIGLLGIPASIAVDAAVLAREDARPAEALRLLLRPWMARHEGGFVLGSAF